MNTCPHGEGRAAGRTRAALPGGSLGWPAFLRSAVSALREKSDPPHHCLISRRSKVAATTTRTANWITRTSNCERRQEREAQLESFSLVVVGADAPGVAKRGKVDRKVRRKERQTAMK
ncbi:hypothetical protein E2C01_039180 [Portunus trituberculatus]|uniref:Uncharacterized protein n=1 Tax=Portunus trituberculatus TaxID=210409 RepID=A0A5B7FG65_PORTR|nr:hypothetical protein [Portunus trituberculatus]